MKTPQELRVRMCQVSACASQSQASSSAGRAAAPLLPCSPSVALQQPLEDRTPSAPTHLAHCPSHNLLQALLRAGYRPTVYRSIQLQVGWLGSTADKP